MPATSERENDITSLANKAQASATLALEEIAQRAAAFGDEQPSPANNDHEALSERSKEKSDEDKQTSSNTTNRPSRQQGRHTWRGQERSDLCYQPRGDRREDSLLPRERQKPSSNTATDEGNQGAMVAKKDDEALADPTSEETTENAETHGGEHASTTTTDYEADSEKSEPDMRQSLAATAKREGDDDATFDRDDDKAPAELTVQGVAEATKETGVTEEHEQTSETKRGKQKSSDITTENEDEKRLANDGNNAPATLVIEEVTEKTLVTNATKANQQTRPAARDELEALEKESKQGKQRSPSFAAQNDEGKGVDHGKTTRASSA
ncbi:hypothetical protein OQA88_1168 [Cercophora sp. LCS_1]